MVAIKHSAVLATAAAIGLGSHAAAQTIQGGYEFRVSNVVSPSQPTATVEVWAWFDNVPGVSELFAAGDFDLIANEPLFVTMRCLLPINCGITSPIINGGMISDINVSQLHLPALGFFGDPSNPLLVFEADWTTSDFTLRGVPVSTENTTRFLVYDAAGHVTELFPAGFSPGRGMISVVPASSLLLFPASAFAMAQRRYRSTVTGINRTSSQSVLTGITRSVILDRNRSH